MNRALSNETGRRWDVWLPGRNELETFLGTIEAESEATAADLARLAYGPEAEVGRRTRSPADPFESVLEDDLVGHLGG